MKKRISDNSKHYNYPQSRLPHFKTSEILSIRNSIDFLGLIYYNTSMVEANNKLSNFPFVTNWEHTDLFYNDAGAKIIFTPKWLGDSVKVGSLFQTVIFKRYSVFKQLFYLCRALHGL